jgi:two-component sensor histidine kinase
MSNILEAKLNPSRQAAGEARRLISKLKTNGINTVLEDLALMVSELVTNSYRYGGLDEGDSIFLHVSKKGKTIRVEIEDPGRGATVPTPRRPTADGGWGLEIVRRTADRWGAHKGTGGTLVWFELDVDDR